MGKRSVRCVDLGTCSLRRVRGDPAVIGGRGGGRGESCGEFRGEFRGTWRCRAAVAWAFGTAATILLGRRKMPPCEPGAECGVVCGVGAAVL